MRTSKPKKAPSNTRKYAPVLLLISAALLLLGASGVLSPVSIDQHSTLNRVRVPGTPPLHMPPLILPSEQLATAAASRLLPDLQRELAPLLVERVVGSAGHAAAKQHILQTLVSLGPQWHIEQDSFTQKTPLGMKTFTNIVATFRPDIVSRMVLAAHYDSKYVDPKSQMAGFIGATDSAAPCALLLDLAQTLTPWLLAAPALNSSLQLIFFDGEEAFVEWTEVDSLYGARHLAQKMAATALPNDSSGRSQLHAIDLFVLLDLLGAPEPHITSSFPNTAASFAHLARVEQRLMTAKLLQPNRKLFFYEGPSGFGAVEDDHVPFLQRNVPVLHVIPRPFPRVWHTSADTATALHLPTLRDLTLIFRVFVAECLHVRVPTQ